MKPGEFLTALESYYGINYQSEIEKKLLREMIRNYNGDLEKLFMKVVQSHSKTFKTLPDIALISAAAKPDDRSIDAEAYRWWTKVSDISCYQDVACEDIRVQACIRAMGGPSGIGNRDPQFENIHRKQFVELFRTFTANPPMEEFQILRGQLDSNPVKFIGDASKCRAMLAPVVEREPVKLPQIGKRVDEVLQ